MLTAAAFAFQKASLMATRGDQGEQTSTARQSDFPAPKRIDTLEATPEATHNLSISSTDAHDQLPQPGVNCYVYITTCLSAPVYQHLTADCNQQPLNAAMLASDKLLQHLVPPGKSGMLARQTEGAKHCQRHFHQCCLGRQKRRSLTFSWLSCTADLMTYLDAKATVQ